MRIERKNMNEQNLAIILGALFAVSEALSLIPAIKSNGVFQFVFNTIKKLAGK